MYYDPLKFPLLDATLIPPPQQTVPYAEDLLESGKLESDVTCGDAPVGDAQQNAEAVTAEEYGAYSDPSLPLYLPRDSDGALDFSHHRRKCLVCRHAYRAIIEHDYLTWRDPAEIAADCGFRDARPILRHAEATGLDRHRARRITSALERLIHKASSAAPSAGSIVSAIKLYAQMTGSWTPPPRQVVVTHVRRVARECAENNAREDATNDVRDEVQQSVPNEAPNDDLAATAPDSAPEVAAAPEESASSGEAASQTVSQSKFRPRTLAGSFLPPSERPSGTRASIPRCAEISNRQPCRLETDVSP